MKKFFCLAAMLLCFITVNAQSDNKVEAALRGSDMLYVVIATIAIIFVGLAIYLFSIDRRLKKIEKQN